MPLEKETLGVTFLNWNTIIEIETLATRLFQENGVIDSSVVCYSVCNLNKIKSQESVLIPQIVSWISIYNVKRYNDPEKRCQGQAWRKRHAASYINIHWIHNKMDASNICIQIIMSAFKSA